MNRRDSYGSCLVEGNVALSPTSSPLQVFEGGKDSYVGREIEVDYVCLRPQRLTAAQVAYFFFVSLTVLIVLAIGICISDDAARNRISDALVSIESVPYVVSPGDSLWSIAVLHSQEGYTTSELVSWLIAKNHLEVSGLSVGQRLYIPASP